MMIINDDDSNKNGNMQCKVPYIYISPLIFMNLKMLCNLTSRTHQFEIRSLLTTEIQFSDDCDVVIMSVYVNSLVFPL